MTVLDLGLQSNPPQLIIDRIRQNSHYRAAIETPQLDEAIELRAQALRMRAELAPIPSVPLPPSADVDLDEWLELTARMAELEQARAVKERALDHLIAAQDGRISSIASNNDRALTRLNQALQQVMGIAAEIVTRLDGCTNATQIVASGNPDVLAAYQDLRRLRVEYDSVRAAQDFLMTGDERANHHRSEWLYDDELATDLAISNLDAIFPRWKRHHAAVSMTRTSDQPEPDPRPWPKDPTEQLIWLATSEARVWVPTKAELRELGQRRMEERRHAGGAPSRRPGRRPNQREQRVNKPSILLNKEIETV